MLDDRGGNRVANVRTAEVWVGVWRKARLWDERARAVVVRSGRLRGAASSRERRVSSWS